METSNNYQQLKVNTSKEVVRQAKAIAKANRKTFGGWLADLIENEVKNYSQERKAQ